MTEERKLPALQQRPRRRGAASILNAADRQDPAPAGERSQAVSEETESVFTFPETPVQGEYVRPDARPTPTPRYTSESPAKVQLGVKVQEDLKGRAKAAFKEAAYHEDVPSFEAFVAQALEAEIRRIEIAHNGGERLEPREESLKRGRPAL